MDQVAEVLLPAARVAVVLRFVMLAVAPLLGSRRAAGSGRWAAAAFVTMATALLLGWLPELAGIELAGWIDQAVVLLILAFPYLLLRFTASSVAPPRWLELAAALLHARSRHDECAAEIGRRVGDGTRTYTQDGLVRWTWIRSRRVLP